MPQFQFTTPERLHLHWYLYRASVRRECVELFGREATRLWEEHPNNGMALLYFRTAVPRLATALHPLGVG